MTTPLSHHKVTLSPPRPPTARPQLLLLEHKPEQEIRIGLEKSLLAKVSEASYSTTQESTIIITRSRSTLPSSLAARSASRPSRAEQSRGTFSPMLRSR